MSGNAVKFVCLEAIKAWQEGQRPAIHDATGIWFNRIPVKAEDVLLALKAKEREGI